MTVLFEVSSREHPVCPRQCFEFFRAKVAYNGRYIAAVNNIHVTPSTRHS